MTKLKRPDYFKCENGERASQAFSSEEYLNRISTLRKIMRDRNIDYVFFTSMHNVAYYTGFIYCAFGRPYGCVVSHDNVTTISANIDAGQPWRRGAFDNLIYTDWQRDNFWRSAQTLMTGNGHIGIEADHLTLDMRKKLDTAFPDMKIVDIAADTMAARMIKSSEEIALIKHGASVADIGGAAIHGAIAEGVREIDVAMAGRNAMELEISSRFPDSEIRDNWVWFQSGINTDGAHNPVTCRKLEQGDILSMNTFPMISGYYTALERTLFLGEPDADSLKIWQANVEAHELGLSLIKPGISCAQICDEINRFFEVAGLLQYRSFGYGHSFGVLSHYYGREAGLELREDIDTVLEPGMVVSMEPMLWVPEGKPGAGGYREHDILVVGDDSVENITKFPYGPAHNIIQS